MPFFLSALLPDQPVKLEKLEYDLRQLNVFLSYMTKKGRNDVKLKVLANHMRDVMHEAKGICNDIGMQITKGNMSLDTWRRFLSIVKEIEHVSVRVERILVTVVDWDPDQNMVQRVC